MKGKERVKLTSGLTDCTQRLLQESTAPPHQFLLLSQPPRRQAIITLIQCPNISDDGALLSISDDDADANSLSNHMFVKL